MTTYNNNCISPSLMEDGYKLSHVYMYPEGTEEVYSTWTARSSKFMYNIPFYVHFGLQYYIKEYLMKAWNEGFFLLPKEEAIKNFSRVYKSYLGQSPKIQHLEDLHDLGYLPIEICAVDEGSFVPIRVPSVTIKNTNPKFHWLTNSLESLFSCTNWAFSTVATKSLIYRYITEKYADESGENIDVCQWQGHDFSMRGMSSLESCLIAGAAHLTSFSGSDCVPALEFIEKYYNVDLESNSIAGSVPATEHSVCSCACGSGENHIEDEVNLINKLLTETYPEGILSYVSDTYSLWDVLDTILPKVKDTVMSRNGKLVVRPDSGDPVKILTGYTEEELWDLEEFDSLDDLKDIIRNYSSSSFEGKMVCIDPYNGEEAKYYRIKNGKIIPVCQSEIDGVVESLSKVFGYTINGAGLKNLDPHIGCLYGDAITPERAIEISERLIDKGFVSTIPVYGIGSYSYQYLTRDTLGFAIKSTSAVVNGERRALFKDPVTDSGLKTSQYGIVKYVVDENDDIVGYEDEKGVNIVMKGRDEDKCVAKPYKTVYKDGVLYEDEDFLNIKNRISEQLSRREEELEGTINNIRK